MRLTRREALQGIGIAGIGAFISACGSGNGTPGTEPTATVDPSATPTAPPTAQATRTSTATSQPASTHSPTPVSTASPTTPAAPSTSPTRTLEATQPPPTETPEATATASAMETSTETPSPSSTPTPTATPTSAVAPSCILSPEQTEGPYFLDLNLLRSDIREDRDGARLRLTLQIVDANGCAPIRDALINLWHASAEGVYSGFAGQPGGISTVGQTFLRGYQVTDADGRVEFITVYPGWYSGRTVHMHLKAHLDASNLLTSQLYFPDDFTDVVYDRAPYNQRGDPDTTNQTDGIIRSGGVTSIDEVILDIVEEGNGYAATMVIGVDLG